MTHYCLDLFLFHLTIYFLFFNIFNAHHFRRVYFYSSTAFDIRAYIAHKRITINWLTLVYVSDERASTYKSFRLNGNCFHIMASILHAQPKNIYVIINIFFFVAFLFQNWRLRIAMLRLTFTIYIYLSWFCKTISICIP